MSQAAPSGRGMPRWSVGWQSPSSGLASMAGLPGTRLWVWVGPPLLARVVCKIALRSVGKEGLGIGQAAVAEEVVVVGSDGTGAVVHLCARAGGITGEEAAS